MKTQIKVTKKVEELQTIEVPAYFKDGNAYFRLILNGENKPVMDKLYFYPAISSHEDEYGFLPTAILEDISTKTPITAKEYWDKLGDMVSYLWVMRDTIIPDSEFPQRGLLR
jgi:hypothetical protein